MDMPRKPTRTESTPVKSYPCGHCGQLIYRTWALAHAGYCEACEWMTPAEAQRETLLGRCTLRAMTKDGRLQAVHVTRMHVLYNRADIEHWKSLKRGWIKLIQDAA